MFLHIVMIILFLILATCHCEHINNSIHEHLGGLIIWTTHFFLFVYCLQSGLEILKYIAKPKIFLFQEECSEHGFSSGKIIFRR